MMRACPFCGKADQVHTTTEVRPMGGYPDDPAEWVVRCEWCGACGSEEPTPLGAIAAWENRKEPESYRVLNLKRRNNADKSA
jgi:hypothetical protein